MTSQDRLTAEWEASMKRAWKIGQKAWVKAKEPYQITIAGLIGWNGKYWCRYEEQELSVVRPPRPRRGGKK